MRFCCILVVTCTREQEYEVHDEERPMTTKEMINEIEALAFEDRIAVADRRLRDMREGRKTLSELSALRT